MSNAENIINLITETGLDYHDYDIAAAAEYIAEWAEGAIADSDDEDATEIDLDTETILETIAENARTDAASDILWNRVQADEFKGWAATRMAA